MGKERRAVTLKKKKIEELKAFIKGKKVIGLVNIEGLPSAQFQEIKKKLRGMAKITVYTNLVIKKAFEDDPVLKNIIAGLKKPTGIIISDENPFTLFKFLKKNRSNMFAKAGQTAPEDIIVPAGETSLAPGPALAELKLAKINVKIDKGKIVVQADSPVAKKGEIVNQMAANALAKLDIKPIKVGININSLLENGIIYTSDVLDIDEEAFYKTLLGSISHAVNLSVNTGYPTHQTIELILIKASKNAQNLALNAEIVNSFTIGKLLAKAQRQASALNKA